MNTLLDKSEIIQRLLYLDKTDDKHFIKKIVELYNDGIDEQTLQSIFWQRYEIEDWLRDKSLDGKDYIALYKENEKGIFRSTIYKTEDVKKVWLSTIVDEDDDVTINKPNSFEEARMLGMKGWCFCDNEDYWIQHTNSTNQNGFGETIYFIHNVLQSNPDDYTTDMVKMDGVHEILNRKHHHLNVPQYLRSVGDMANKLVPTSKRIKESKTINMKTENRNRNVVRLTESQLKQIVAESVKKVLRESAIRGIDINGRPTHYATQDDEHIDYAMEQCAEFALNFILDKNHQVSTEWFKEFCDKVSHDKLFNTLDKNQVKECWIKGNRAAHSCVYKGNSVEAGRIPTHYEGEWQD